MSTTSRRLVLASAAVVALSGALLAQNKNPRTPALVTFSDRSGDKISSDLKGSYLDGQECVLASADKGGFFLRTVSPDCPTPPPRSIVLAFSDSLNLSCPNPTYVYDQYDPTLKLNICGSNAVPDVRVIANSLFKDTALVNGTTVTLPFLLKPSFNGRTDPRTVFELDFENAVPVSGGSSVRVLEAAPDTVAELYQYVNGKKVSLGRYRMPFQLTVTKQ